MPTRSIFALSALAFAQTVTSVLWHGPVQTPMANKLALDYNGYSSRPTAAPGSEQHQPELQKRLIASARTCGWLFDASASSSSVFACNIGTCGYFSTSGTIAQGCCSLGYSSCVVPTTCYDYAQYTSSRCTGSCYENDFNLVCTRLAAAKCQTYTYPGRAIRGYGCDTDTESTTTTIYSTYVSGASAGSAFATTYTAFLSIIPAYALTSSSASRYSYTYTYAATTRYPSQSTYIDNSLGAAILAPVIAVVVIWALGYICVIVLLIVLCRRHKRNMTAIDQQNAARAAGVGNVASAVPYTGTNVLSPGSHQSTYFGSDTHSGVYGNKSDPSPQMTQHYPAPIPTPPPMTGSPAPTYNTTPGQQQQQPYYGAAMSTPNTNSTYGYPQPQHSPPPAAHEMYSPAQSHEPNFPLQNHQPQAGQGYAYSPPVPPAGTAVPASHPPTTNQGSNMHEMQ